MGKAENRIETYLMSRCGERGILCLKFVSPSLAGVPDRVCIGHGLVFFVEAKAPGEKPRPLQVQVIQTLKDHGARVYVASTAAEVDQIMQEIDALLNPTGRLRGQVKP